MTFADSIIALIVLGDNSNWGLRPRQPSKRKIPDRFAKTSTIAHPLLDAPLTKHTTQAATNEALPVLARREDDAPGPFPCRSR